MWNFIIKLLNEYTLYPKKKKVKPQRYIGWDTKNKLKFNIKYENSNLIIIFCRKNMCTVSKWRHVHMHLVGNEILMWILTGIFLLELKIILVFQGE